MSLRLILKRFTFIAPLLVATSLHGQLGLFQSPINIAGEHFGSTIVTIGTDRVLIGRYLFDLQGNLIRAFEDPEPNSSGSFAYSAAAVGTDKVLIGSPPDAA